MTVSILLLMLGAIGGWLTVVAVAGLAVAICEVALHGALAPGFPNQIDNVLGELHARLALEQALLLVYVVRVDEVSAAARAIVVVAVVAYQLLRVVHTGARLLGERLAIPRAQVRNIPDFDGPRPAPTGPVGPRAVQLVIAATGLPALGLLWAAVTNSFALVAPAAVAMVLVAACVVAMCTPAVLRMIRRPRGLATVTAVHEAVVRQRPVVVLYCPGGPTHLHWITPWLDTLDELGKRGRPALVMVQDPQLFARLPRSATPVVCLPDARDVLPFTLPDARVAMYVANSRENLLLLRNSRLRSALIFHSDGDKAANASPLAKMYDEIWVAGEAARARYVAADVGIRAEQIRVVGRPQIRRIRRTPPATADRPFSVLYTPTWEGLYQDPAESSLLHSGLEIVRCLLAIDGVRVLYRPHPNTGSRDYRFSRAHERILATVASAGTAHALLDPATTDLYDALNMADMLVTDISGVLTDFVASDRPYAIINGTDLNEHDFREQFPSAAGATVVGRHAAGLADAVEDARGPDSMRAAREGVRNERIGPPTQDPISLFADAIDALGDTLPPRSSADAVVSPRNIAQ